MIINDIANKTKERWQRLQKLAPARSPMNGIRGPIIRQLLNSWQKNMLAE